jgi:hypothetical protein
MPSGYVPGAYLGMAVKLIDVGGIPTVFPVLGQRIADAPQDFWGILTYDVPTPKVTAGRGLQVVPVREGGLPFVAGRDVYLSVVQPGALSQATPQAGGDVMLRVGFALDATKVVLSNDFRVDYY